MNAKENPLNVKENLIKPSVPCGQEPFRCFAKRVLAPFCVMCLLSLAVYCFKIPNPNMILITGLSVFTSLYGYAAGISCGAVMILYSMFFFSTGHDFVTYEPINLQKMGIILLGVVLNVLFIGHLKKVHTEAENQLIELNLALRTDNASLEQASAIDGLTGTRNRYAFRRDYDAYEGRDIHVMMFDLDNFKTTNDTYGHAMGDFALKNTGRFLREAFGDAYCYRYGGDEFVVICPDMPEGAFFEKLAQIRTQMHALSLDAQSVPATFSAGYVYGHAELSTDLRLMLRHADHNLYESKERGKDRFTGSAYSRAFAEELEQRMPSVREEDAAAAPF